MRLARRSDFLKPPDPQGPSPSPETSVLVQDEPERMLRLPQVRELIPVSEATIWRLVRAGKLARPIHLTSNAVAWKRSAILEYLRECEANRKNESQH